MAQRKNGLESVTRPVLSLGLDFPLATKRGNMVLWKKQARPMLNQDIKDKTCCRSDLTYQGYLERLRFVLYELKFSKKQIERQNTVPYIYPSSLATKLLHIESLSLVFNIAGKEKLYKKKTSLGNGILNLTDEVLLYEIRNIKTRGTLIASKPCKVITK